MLRVSVLQRPASVSRRAARPVHGRRSRPLASSAGAEPFALDPGAGVERSIRALRLLAEIDWKTFFEKTNRVEAILRTDPAQVYARMDFATCDAVPQGGRGARVGDGHAEAGRGRAARSRSRASRSPDERRGHVGYYLVDAGRRVLETAPRLSPRGLERVRRALTRRPTLSYLAAARAPRPAVPLLARRGGTSRATDARPARRSRWRVAARRRPGRRSSPSPSCSGRSRASSRRARCRSSTSRRASPTTREPSS